MDSGRDTAFQDWMYSGEYLTVLREAEQILQTEPGLDKDDRIRCRLLQAEACFRLVSENGADGRPLHFNETALLRLAACIFRRYSGTVRESLQLSRMEAETGRYLELPELELEGWSAVSALDSRSVMAAEGAVRTRHMLSLPLFRRPFQKRVREVWSVFETFEAEIRRRLEAGQTGQAENLVRRILSLLTDRLPFTLTLCNGTCILHLQSCREPAMEFAAAEFLSAAPAGLGEQWILLSEEPDGSMKAHAAVPGPEMTWRRDGAAGHTRCPSLLEQMEGGRCTGAEALLHAGAVPGCLCFPLDRIQGSGADAAEPALSALRGAAEDGTGLLLGSSRGQEYLYLDFLAWDLQALLERMLPFVREHGLAGTLFHTLTADSRGIPPEEWSGEPEVQL